jgi:LysM repeat protein
MTHRRNARLGTGALALALLAPVAGATAAEPADPGEEQEHEHEGADDPGTPGNDAGGGDLTPGQGSTDDLVDEGTPALIAPGDTPDDGESENGPLEAGSPTQVLEGAPSPVPPVPPAIAPAPPTAPAPPAPPSVQETAPSSPVPSPHARAAPVRAERRATPPEGVKRRVRHAKREVRKNGGPVPVARTTQDPRPVQVAKPARDVGQSPTPPASAARRGTYTVRAGDTLWAIASAQLGAGATPGQVAREVQRLWEKNKDVIGTGDPDLVGVGVTLRF